VKAGDLVRLGEHPQLGIVIENTAWGRGFYARVYWFEMSTQGDYRVAELSLVR